MSDTYARSDGAASGAGPETREVTPASSTAALRAAPRLHYRKSRNGCQRCRSRRVKVHSPVFVSSLEPLLALGGLYGSTTSVQIQPWYLKCRQLSFKCNEVHPVCGSCQRHEVPCTYDRPGKTSLRREPDNVGNEGTGSDNSLKLHTESATTSGYPDSRTRRLLELKLLHHWTLKTSRTVPGALQTLQRNTWSDILPRMALESDALLNVICSCSALHLSKIEPHNPQWLDAYQTYFDMTLREHYKDVAQLSKANADMACMTSSVLRLLAFAILQERPLDQYTPPRQWLEMTKGAGKVFRVAWPFIVGDENSVALALIRAPPLVAESEVVFAESNRQNLLHLLRRPSNGDADEPWDTEAQEAYKDTVSYIGSIQNGIAAEESPMDVCRRLMAFPMMIPRRFIDLVEEEQPRALVIMAHFFAMLARFRDLWWVGDTGWREVRAIQRVLSDEWQDLMCWPLGTMDEKFAMA